MTVSAYGLQSLPVTDAATGSVSGRVADPAGAPVSGALVSLEDSSTNIVRAVRPGAGGEFQIPDLPDGEFHISVTAPGFYPSASEKIILSTGQAVEMTPIALRVAAPDASVQVNASRYEIALAQMRSEEKQRLLGVLPNFYVSYYADTAPLTAGQKMRLAWRTAVDPSSFVASAITAGIETNFKEFKDYGTGAAGFGRRYGAAFGDDFFGVMLGAGVLPALFRQDPRYYYKGTGSKTSRVVYALSWSFRCKGDNGKWQPNYSFLLGDLAATGVSDLYYPKALRDSAGKTIEYSFENVAFQGVGAILQEFLFKKVTTHTRDEGKLP